MSHFATIKTKMKNADAIIAALQEMGLTAEMHEQAVSLNTVWGDRSGTGNIVVRREVLTKAGFRSNVDLGFLQDQDGSYQMVGDRFYAGVAKIMDRLPAEYGKQVVIQTAKSLGDEYTVQRRLDANGEFAGYQIIVEKTATPLSLESSVSSQLYAGY